MVYMIFINAHKPDPTEKKIVSKLRSPEPRGTSLFRKGAGPSLKYAG
jgi:hypothetical protein